MTMDRLFRIDFYPQDWLIDTARLDPLDRGIFIQIIMLIYANRGPIVNDAGWIAGVSGTSKTVVKNSLNRLFSSGFLQENEGKITQKRTENELKSKANHLENSSKGGRKGGGHNKKNNDLPASDDQEPLPSPSPSPNPSASPSAKERSDQAPKPPQFNQQDYSILDNLDDDGLMDARVFASAGGHDLNSLAQAFNNAIKQGIMERPRKPNKAFSAWIRKLSTKRQ
jgi:uncharacterized protein YdaU (DUF1376 family)